jgi:hypothetical protein
VRATVAGKFKTPVNGTQERDDLVGTSGLFRGL